MDTIKQMTGKQELALQVAAAEVARWRAEERMAADGIALARHSAVRAVKAAVKSGVPQVAIAAECGWSRQRVHQLVTKG